MAANSLKAETIGSVTVASIGPAFETIDDEALDQVSAFLLELTAEEEMTRLVIDLSQTSFFGSALLAIIFRVWSRIKARNGHFALCGLQDYCRDVLRTTRLDTVWAVFDTREEALRCVEEQ